MSEKKLQELKEQFEEIKKKLTIAENDLTKSQKVIKDEFGISTIKEAMKLQEKLGSEIDNLEKERDKLICEIEEKLSKIEEDNE